jgi:hypothetical protein
MSKSAAPGPRPSTTRAVAQTQTGASPELANKVDALAAKTASNEAEHRHSIIADAAQLRAGPRQFEPGHDVEDGLAAESAPSSYADRRSSSNPRA